MEQLAETDVRLPLADSHHRIVSLGETVSR
jgi:hypothetical protein